MVKIMRNQLKLLVFCFIIGTISACPHEASENEPEVSGSKPSKQQIPDPESNQQINDAFEIIRKTKPHVVFRKGVNFNFRPGMWQPIINDASNNFSQHFPILFVFLDSLRNDYFADNMSLFSKHLLAEDGWVNFQAARSSSTITHYSTYSAYYGNLSFARDFVLRFNWKTGSPFLNILKEQGYKIYDYGSPWQNCPPQKLLNKNENDLKYSSGGNTQLVFGLQGLDFCFKGHSEHPLLLPEIPQAVKPVASSLNFQPDSVNTTNPLVFKDVEVYGKKLTYNHQAYLDYAVLNKFTDALDNNLIDKKSFTQLYFFSSHMGYAWPEYGIPDKEWKTFTNAAQFNRYKPYFPFTPNESKYLDSSHTTEEKIKNSYANSAYYMNYLLDRLIKALKKDSKYDDYFIAVFSDHGEKIYEGDRNIITWDMPPRVGSTHCCLPVNSNTNIPMYLKFPKSLLTTRDIKPKYPMGRLYDIFPTLFDALGFNNLNALKSVTNGVSLLQKSNAPRCNVSVSPSGEYGPVFFNISDGKKAYYFSLDEPRTFDALGIFFLRVVDEKSGAVITEFEKGNKQDVLEKYLQDPTLKPCFKSLFGKDFMSAVWYGERDEF